MIELKNVTKSYNAKTDVVKNFNMKIYDGEIIVLIGESGCGKTTTLQMINRLISPTAGSIYINGTDISTINKSELRRRIGYVIQDVGLLPHKTVAQNIATVPLLCKKDKCQIEATVHDLMDFIGLPYEEYGSRFPNELSGGQQQRVGVARALANDPDIILMDEPFSALDPITREQLQDELLRLHDEFKKTIVFVTHDMDEAIKLGDRIAIMQAGEIAQFDTPEKILRQPANEFVANFIGKNRLWSTPDFLRAKDVIAEETVTVTKLRTAIQTLEILKKRKAIVAAVVERVGNKQNFCGLIGLNRLLQAADDSVKIQTLMKTDVMQIPADMPLPEVLAAREKEGVRFSPVVEQDGSFVGIISYKSIVNVLSDLIPGKEEY